MIDVLIDSVRQLGKFSPGELESLERAVVYKKLAKGEILLHQGEVCQAVYLVAEGALLQYKMNENVEEEVLDLYVQKDWAFNPLSFTTQKPSESYIITSEESLIFELTIESIHQLIAESQSFLQIGKIFGHNTARMHLFDNYKTPDDQYLYLLKHKPTLIQKFPQKRIASYLRISPETLSRVRKRIVKNRNHL